MPLPSIRSILPGVAVITMLASAVAYGQTDDVATGPNPLLTTGGAFNWMRGAISDSTVAVSQLRIMSTRMSGDRLIVHAIPLDGSGNIIRSGLTGWSVTTRCRSTTEASVPHTPDVREVAWTPASSSTSAVLCIDNSAASGRFAADVLTGLRGALTSMTGRDSIGILILNHDTERRSPLAPTSLAAESSSADSIETPNGLTALWASAMQGIAMLADQASPDKVLILATTSDDNASVLFRLKDVVDKARSLDIRVYCINAAETTLGYLYRYASGTTAGRNYTIANEDGSDVGNIVREILFASKHYVELSVPAPETDAACADLVVGVKVEGPSGSSAADSVRLPVRDRDLQPSVICVAAFPDSSEGALQDYYSLLVTLAERLMEDNTLDIELIGHVGLDYKGNAVARGAERARFVADFLTGYGVNTSQVHTRSAGSAYPLYYMQQEASQRLLNNRVELRWLRPDDEPYTVTVGQVESEEQAEKLVHTWSARKYKAYFEPVVVDNAPAYRVKVWGFATRSQATAAADGIRKKYKVKTAIE